MKFALRELIARSAVTGGHVAFVVQHWDPLNRRKNTPLSTSPRLGLSAPASYVRLCRVAEQSGSQRDGSHHHCNQCILAAADIAFTVHLFFPLISFFLLPHSCQKGLLLLLSVSDSTSLLSHCSVIHAVHAGALAVNHKSKRENNKAVEVFFSLSLHFTTFFYFCSSILFPAKHNISLVSLSCSVSLALYYNLFFIASPPSLL